MDYKLPQKIYCSVKSLCFAFCIIFFTHASANANAIIECNYGKIFMGKVVPFTSSQNDFPKVWTMESPNENYPSGRFFPAEMPSVRYYANYKVHFEVLPNEAKVILHQLSSDYKLRKNFFVKLNRISGKIVIKVTKTLPAKQLRVDEYTTVNDIERRGMHSFVDVYEGVCEKQEVKF